MNRRQRHFQKPTYIRLIHDMQAIGIKTGGGQIREPDSDRNSYIHEFPGEFKKKWFKHLDSRFMTILILTFVFEVGALLILLSWVQNRDSTPNIYAIHEKYAKLLLNRFEGNQEYYFKKNKETFLFGVAEYIEQPASTAEDQYFDSNSVPTEKKGFGGSGRGGTQGASQSIINSPDVGQEGTESSDLATQIAKQGLLNYITTDGEIFNNEEIKEIFSISDRQSRNLEGSLSNVTFANFKKVEAGISDLDGAGTVARRKGSTRAVAAEDLQSAFSPKSEALVTAIAKNTELENFSISALADGGKRTSARKAENVAQVIHSHNRAIQDCYKQALRKEPDLKGKVVVRIMIAPNGEAESVQILQSTIEYEPMLQCIISRIRQWRDFGDSDPSLGSIGYRQTYIFGY